MSKATLIFEDGEDGTIKLRLEFDHYLNEKSEAHQLAASTLASVIEEMDGEIIRESIAHITRN